jgi:hypothetical protein
MEGDKCPFDFNLNPDTFKIGDLVSYRIPDRFADFPFMGTIVAVHETYIEIAADPSDPANIVRGTRESRPIVANYGFSA